MIDATYSLYIEFIEKLCLGNGWSMMIDRSIGVCYSSTIGCYDISNVWRNIVCE